VKPIHLLSVGADLEPAPGGRLHNLAEGLSRIFRAPCRLRVERIDAAPAYDAQRGQYYSTEILRRMQPLRKDGARLLGVTPLDLYVPVLTFVFGEAQLEGDCAVVSFHRLQEEFYGMPANAELAADRLLKEAVHELGHTFGLRHCFDWRCVMASSHAVEFLDVKGADFCPACRRVVDGKAPVLRVGG
jgi:archaemetzincin